MSKYIILGSALTIILAFFFLLSIALVKTQNVPAGAGVNSEFGEMVVQPKLAPDFEITTLLGDTIRLSDLRGKVVMIEFWASWCPPCREEAPNIAKVYNEYSSKPVEFIGIDVWDQSDRALEFVEEFSIDYPTGTDSTGEILVNYGIRGIPEKYFINKQGYIVGKFVGPSKPEKLEEMLVWSEAEGLAFNLLKVILAERLPIETKLLPNYPNPFNPETWIPFELNQDSKVSVAIYNVAGTLVRNINVGYLQAGIYVSQSKAIYWDGRTDKGERVANGTHFCTLRTDASTLTRKMIILK